MLEATTEGDGRVTYQSGRLPGVATWYVEAEHGDLADHEPAFPAIRGTARARHNDPPGDDAAQRDARGVSSTRPCPSRCSIRKRQTSPTACSVVAGRALSAARQGWLPRVGGARRPPLLAAIRSSWATTWATRSLVPKRQIDRMLDGALSDRYNLGLYPGQFGSVAVVLRQPSEMQQALGLPHGAVVIGLGKWGDLTAAQLANLIRRAALHYVLQLDDSASDDSRARPATAGLSFLLLGGNSAANISTEDSVAAILRGIAQANREIDAQKPGIDT